MFGNVLVYSSKDKEDWEKAQKLLNDAHIIFSCREAEEPPVGGCGSKIDIRSFMKKEPVSRIVYKIEVKKSEEKQARFILDGNVLPIRSFGTMM